MVARNKTLVAVSMSFDQYTLFQTVKLLAVTRAAFLDHAGHNMYFMTIIDNLHDL